MKRSAVPPCFSCLAVWVWCAAALLVLPAKGQSAMTSLSDLKLEEATEAKVGLIPVEVSYRFALDETTMWSQACTYRTKDRSELTDLVRLVEQSVFAAKTAIPMRDVRNGIVFNFRSGAPVYLTMEESLGREYVNGALNGVPLVLAGSLPDELRKWSLRSKQAAHAAGATCNH
ncbi:hypothetical protein [Massilia endophytica]|uniref:hypothetical protein n=1 Tax=Massilia endophytica TaxID=2899220 RepID=UPI001E5F4CDC|nr:hypothetical protein [Massilia endophytica]UGQ48169.1 hypothetical protein LSQ66_06805 [Massilia endophytica]